MPACPSCGRSVDEHDRHVRFTLPDPVLELPERERTPGSWMTGQTARESVLMQFPPVGAFVRALLPVRLSGGHMLTFGVWLAVDPGDLQQIAKVWLRPEYQELVVTGRLANAVPPWGLLTAPVQAIVRDPDETPYCDSSAEPELDRVLHDEWPHDVVLAAIER